MLSLVGALSMLAPDTAFAQSASFRSVDTNSDGVLTFNELAAAFGRAGAARLFRSTDHNGDGRITIPELRRGPDDERRPSSSFDRDDDRGDDRDSGDDNGDDGDDGDDDGDDD